jgi:hypothetical protein
MARMNHPKSWAYVAFAIALDFVVIYLLTQFNLHYGRRRQTNNHVTEAHVDQRFQTDPRFLWVQPS